MFCTDDRLHIVSSVDEGASIPLRYTEAPLVKLQNLEVGEALLLPKDFYIEGNVYNFTCPTGSVYNISLLDGTSITIEKIVNITAYSYRGYTVSYTVTFGKAELNASRIVHPIPLLPCPDAECDSYSVESILKFSPPEHAVKKSARK